MVYKKSKKNKSTFSTKKKSKYLTRSKSNHKTKTKTKSQLQSQLQSQAQKSKRQKGGEFIGVGSFGCVVEPMIQCRKKIKDKNYVSKL
jgi:hypothetical protein